MKKSAICFKQQLVSKCIQV